MKYNPNTIYILEHPTEEGLRIFQESTNTSLVEIYPFRGEFKESSFEPNKKQIKEFVKDLGYNIIQEWK